METRIKKAFSEWSIVVSAILVINLTAMNFAMARASRRVQVDPTPTPIASVMPSPTPEVTGDKITFTCANCGAEERAMLPKMQKLLNAVKDSQCFADHYILTKYRSQLVQTDGISREEVVKKITSAVVLNIPLFFYYPTWRQSKNVIGYTTPDTPIIYLNRLFRESYDWDLCSEVSNEMHESTHKMGFDHDYNATSRRPYSVPYTANYAVDECCPAIKKQLGL